MPQFRRRPAVIEAVQLRWTTWNDVCAFVGDTISPTNPARYITAEEASDTCGEDGPQFIAFDVTTIHGDKATVRHGDWIVRDGGRTDRFYPVKPDIFAATYEPVESVPWLPKRDPLDYTAVLGEGMTVIDHGEGEE